MSLYIKPFMKVLHDETGAKLAAITSFILQPFRQVDNISKREFDVIDLAVKGLGVQEIASELEIHRQTVYQHMNNITAKIEAHYDLEIGTTGLDGLVIRIIREIIES